MNSQSRKSSLLRINLVLAVFYGLLTLWQMTRDPSEQEAAFLWGFSIARVGILFVIILMILLIIVLFVQSFKRGFWASRIGKVSNHILEKNEILIALVGMTVLLYLALFSSDMALGKLAPYRIRLFPLLMWFTVLFMQLLILQLLLKIPGKSVFLHYRNVFLITLIVFIGLGMVGLFIATTRLGLEPDIVLWQEAGTPILFLQVMLAWGTGVGFSIIFQSRRIVEWKKKFPFLQPRHVEIFICVSLWLLAYFLWISYPLRPSYNSLGPTAPNYQSYPFADSMIYDANAQGFFIGDPIPNDFTQKPFYSFFLVILHALVGQNYEQLIQLQVALFAFIPIVMYLLVKGLSTRPAGLIAAILVIFRERNSLALSNVVQVTHSRLLMSDMLAMGLMVLLIFFTITWLRHPRKRSILPITIGGILGLFVLTRLNSILLLPFVVLSGVLILWPIRKYGKILNFTLFIIIGLSIPFGIWMWRNYRLTGKFVVQVPVVHYTEYIAKLYSLDPQTSPPLLPGEDYDTYYARIQGQPLSFIKQHPDEVFRFVSAHFMHNMLYSFVYLPNSLINESPISYVKRMPFWKDWSGQLSGEMRGFLVFNLLVLSFGTTLIWKKSRHFIFIPLLVGMGYYLSVSLGRVSGWRFILPVDWITLVFYSAGLVQISYIIYSYITKKTVAIHPEGSRTSDREQEISFNWLGYSLIGLLLVGISLGLTIGHTFYSNTYSERSPEELFSTYSELIPEQGFPLPPSLLERFLAREGAISLAGRGIYPSYLSSKDGELNWWYLAFAPRSYDRLVFQIIGTDKYGVIGPDEIGVVLPLSVAPESFPDAAEVIVFGCLVNNEYDEKLPGYIEALIVVEYTSSPMFYIRTPIPDLICPLPETSVE